MKLKSASDRYDDYQKKYNVDIKKSVHNMALLQKVKKNTESSYNSRRYRLLQRVRRVLKDDYVYFITFTLKEACIDFSLDTIRRKIKETLGCASNWVANEDYGKTSGRLHFHALAGFNFQLDYTTLLEIYKYGAINIRRVNIFNDTAFRNYLDKLTYHATKITASTIFYSRKKREKKL